MDRRYENCVVAFTTIFSPREYKTEMTDSRTREKKVAPGLFHFARRIFSPDCEISGEHIESTLKE